MKFYSAIAFFAADSYNHFTAVEIRYIIRRFPVVFAI